MRDKKNVERGARRICSSVQEQKRKDEKRRNEKMKGERESVEVHGVL